MASTFLLHVEQYSVHRRGDQLVAEHAPDFRYVLSRSDERRSQHIPPGLKPAMCQTDFLD
jgi:hypothetical protein